MTVPGVGNAGVPSFDQNEHFKFYPEQFIQMAHRILDTCTYCAACEPECPVAAITAGQDMYIIDENICTDCVGFHDDAACVIVCPVDCIIKV